MASTARICAIVLLLVPCGRLEISALAQTRTSEPLAIVVHLQTYVDESRSELKAALDHAARAFRAIDVRAEWREVSNVQRVTTRPGEFTVLLLSPDMVARKCAMDRLGPTVLGSSAPTVGRAWIFMDRIADAARRTGLPTGEILGQVIAHEVGHLVLLDDAHDHVGIMREQVQLSGATPLRFTAAQGQRIRSMLSSPSALELVARHRNPIK